MFHFCVSKAAVASLYVDYVPTESNIADVPSRWHEMDEAERASWRPKLGRWIEAVLPNFADAQGNWLSYKAIATQLWQ